MELIGRSFAFPWEVQLMAWLQSHLGPAAIRVISAFSMLGEELVLVLFLGFIYWSWNKKAGRSIGLNLLMGLVWAPMIKNIFLRRRPYFDHKEISILRPVDKDADLYDIAAQGYSFPSGHSVNAVIAFGSAAALAASDEHSGRHGGGTLAISHKGGARPFGISLKNGARLFAICAAVLVGTSRVIVGAHYPTDVLGGWLLGLLVIWLVPLLERCFPKMETFYLVLLIISLPGMIYCRSADYFTGMGLLLGFMGGTLFEEKHVRFENTRKPVFAILRVVLGFALFLAMNVLFKFPFSDAFLESGSMGALLFRTARYAVMSFVVFGVYPMLFTWL